MKNYFTYFLAAATGMILLAGCPKEPSDGNGEEHADRRVNEWVLSTLRADYLWSNQSDWINANSSPQYDQSYETFFENALQRPPTAYADNAPHDGYYYDGDWIPYSYLLMEDPAARSVSGSYSFGFEFGLMNIFGTVYAYVIYVGDDSPAAGAGLRRGDWIGTVNGRTMTPDNYTGIYSEMIGSASNVSVTLGLYDITFGGRNGNQISLSLPSPRAGSLTLTAARVDDDPVHLYTMIEGTQIGYLVYNGFQRGRDPATLEDDVNDTTYEDKLREAFRYFLNNGAEELVIDLRYNPGGYNVTCCLLASLVRPAQSVGQDLFVQYQSRVYLGTGQFDSPGYYDYFMTTTNNPNLPGTGVENYPGFSRIYVLTSSRTASASEMLINSLRGAVSGAVEVHVIGGTTAGKNVGSSLHERTVDGKEYSMYPIMFQNFNARGESNFANGFAPGTNSGSVSSYVLDELIDGMVTNQAYRLKEWGSPDDPLLGRAIELVTGFQRTSGVSAPHDVQDARGSVATMRILPESSLDRKPVRGSIHTASTPE